MLSNFRAFAINPLIVVNSKKLYSKSVL